MKNIQLHNHTVRTLAIALAMMAIWAGAPVSRAWAADAPAVTPAPAAAATPAAVAAPVATPAPAAAAAPEVKAAEQSKVILAKLEGLVFVNDAKKIAPAGIKDMYGVRVLGVPVLEQDEFRQKMAAYLGKPLTEAVKAKILEDIVVFYREQDRPILDVSTPPQEITAGVLQVLVMEGTVGQIRVEGARWFDSKTIERQVSLKQGDPLNSSVILNDLDWLNRNPFRQVDLVYVKGTEPGKTDMVFRQNDQVPWRFYTGSENSGTKLTEDTRWLAGTNWGNVFGGEGQLNYQFMSSPHMKFFNAHSASFTQPLPWRHILSLYGSYGTNKADIATTSPISLEGYSWQAAMRYEVPLYGSRNYKHSLVAGFDFKQSNSELYFGDFKAFGTAVDVAQFSLGYNANMKDPWGMTSLRATAYYSQGGFTDRNTTDVFKAIRANATPNYTYGRVDLNRTTGLPLDFMLVNQVTFQASDANLLGSEQLGFGGYDSIRGYNGRVINSDRGVIVSNELRTPPVSLLGKRAADKLQLLVFADYGYAKDKMVKKGTELLGVGPGLRYTISSHFSLRSDYGMQLHNVEGAFRKSASQWHFGMVLSY